MHHEVDSLHSQIRTLEGMLEQENHKVAILQERTLHNDSGMLMSQHEVSLDSLTSKARASCTQHYHCVYANYYIASSAFSDSRC